MMEAPYKKIHVVINPAAGKDEPILNTLNDVFRHYDVDWNVSVTKKYGDATEQARTAAAAEADLVAAYGGDGTQHEIANGILGTNAVMGVLPGGVGNGFATELGTPKELRPAVELLCTGGRLRSIDVVQLGDSYFIQRLYVGIEPEEQTSREDKDKYGTFAYVVNTYHRARERKDREVHYRITIDGQVIEMPAMKLYVVNAAKAGTGIAVTGDFSKPDDGLWWMCLCWMLTISAPWRRPWGGWSTYIRTCPTSLSGAAKRLRLRPTRISRCGRMGNITAVPPSP